MRMLLLALVMPLAACDDGEPRTIDGAQSAYSQNRVGEAEAILRKIVADPAAVPGDQAAAHLGLARMAWLIDGNADKALAEIGPASRDAASRCDASQLLARILREAGRPERLVPAAEKLAGRCEATSEADSIRLEAAAAALDIFAVAGPKPALADAARLLDAASEDARTSLRGSAIRLQLALATGDAAGALQAWKDYFWLSDTDMPQALARAVPDAQALFADALRRAATAGQRLRLVDLMVHAGFAAEAERFAAAHRLGEVAKAHPAWRRAKAYFNARRTIEHALLESNRRVARGGKASDLKALFDGAQAELLAAAGLSGDPADVLRRAYGLYAMVGDTDGYASLHIGHVVQLEQKAIEQYGHRATVTFVAIDNMIANGFNSWLWDGAAAAGGWTEPGPIIVQVRPGYTSGPLSAWRWISDPGDRQQRLAREAKLAAKDLAAVRNSEIAYLPGLAQRLQHQLAELVGAEARRRPGGSADLRRAFLAEYWRASFQQSIFLHEGRHALDRSLVRGLARLRDSNLEYRAKLSELALADYPRLALLNIDAATIGDGSAHGKANARILADYVAWMGAHPAEIRGYDASRPTLVQIDKLSDAQLRAIARALDPIAPKS